VRTITDLFLAAIFTAYALVLILAWLNRGSEKIATAIIPIGIAAIAGTLYAVLVFGAQPKISSKFIAGYVVDLPSKLPVNLPGPIGAARDRWSTWRNIEELRKRKPELFHPDEGNEFPERIYRDLAQKEIIEWLSLRFGHQWVVEGLTSRAGGFQSESWGPAGDSTREKKEYSPQELENILGNNLFAKTGFLLNNGLALPPGTTLTVTTADKDSSRGEILLANKLCRIRILTLPGGGMRGAGEYSRLLKLSEKESWNIGTIGTLVETEITFNRWRSGDPEMPIYKTWALSITNGIASKFDENLIWDRTLRNIQQEEIMTSFNRASKPH
jgi:hypothetical protein